MNSAPCGLQSPSALGGAKAANRSAPKKRHPKWVPFLCERAVKRCVNTGKNSEKYTGKLLDKLEFNYFLSAFPNEQECGDEYRTLFEIHFLKIKKRTAEAQPRLRSVICAPRCARRCKSGKSLRAKEKGTRNGCLFCGGEGEI